jgi:hypothetical protein
MQKGQNAGHKDEGEFEFVYNRWFHIRSDFLFAVHTPDTVKKVVYMQLIAGKSEKSL